MSDQPSDPGTTGPPAGWQPPRQDAPTAGGPPSPADPYGVTPVAYGGAPTSSADASFFRALFDLSFTRFITPMIVKFVYVLMIVVIAIVYLFYAILLFQAGSSSIGVLWLLVIGPIASVLWLAIARMTLEFYLAVVRVSEDVRHAVSRGGR